MPELAKSLQNVENKFLKTIGNNKIRLFNQEFSKYPGTIKLVVGEPDFNTPEHVKQAAIKSIQDNYSHYSPQKGFDSLRQAISNYLNSRYDLTYDPESEIIVTVGATEAIYLSVASIINVGDKVIIPTPAFSFYASTVKALGGVPVEVDVTDNDFKLNSQRLRDVIASEGEDNIKAVILNFPSNPTGVAYDQAEIEDLASVIRGKSIYVICDEIYSELVYDVKHVPFASVLPEQTILINGVSKSHSMTGYRIGYIAAPASFVAETDKLHAFTTTVATNAAQFGAEEALKNGLDDPIQTRKIYKQRRDYLVKELNDLGYPTLNPQGAFYVFPKIPKEFGLNSESFARKLAKDARVGVIPGSIFGKGGDSYFRISYAVPLDDLKEAIKRIKKFTEDFEHELA